MLLLANGRILHGLWLEWDGSWAKTNRFLDVVAFSECVPPALEFLCFQVRQTGLASLGDGEGERERENELTFSPSDPFRFGWHPWAFPVIMKTSENGWDSCVIWKMQVSSCFLRNYNRDKKQSDGFWLHEAWWCPGGLMGTRRGCWQMILPRPVSGYRVLQCGAMLPAHLQGNSRDEGSQPLRNGCSFGAGHSLRFPLRRDLGWNHARNQSLQLSFLDSGVELKQAEMAANQPDKEGADHMYLVTWFLSLSFLYLGKQEARRRCWRCWKRDHGPSWLWIFPGAPLLGWRQPWHPPTEPGPLTMCPTFAFLKLDSWS